MDLFTEEIRIKERDLAVRDQELARLRARQREWLNLPDEPQNAAIVLVYYLPGGGGNVPKCTRVFKTSGGWYWQTDPVGSSGPRTWEKTLRCFATARDQIVRFVIIDTNDTVEVIKR